MDLIERAKAIILTPKTEWLAIESEPGDPPYLFRNYVAILAAIPAVCGFIGMSIVGVSAPMAGTYRIGVLGGLAAAIVRYVLTFVVVYVMAMITDALAPTFGATKSQPSALKLIVYAMTPIWLVGVFALVPGLHILRILGLYGLYLFWLGLPVMMKAPGEKTVPYAAAVVVCGIVVWLLVGVLVYAISWA